MLRIEFTLEKESDGNRNTIINFSCWGAFVFCVWYKQQIDTIFFDYAYLIAPSFLLLTLQFMREKYVVTVFNGLLVAGQDKLCSTGYALESMRVISVRKSFIGKWRLEVIDDQGIRKKVSVSRWARMRIFEGVSRGC